MRKLLLIAASAAFVLVCTVSVLGQNADKPQQVTPENRKTPDEAQGESGKDEDDANESKRKVTLQVIIRSSGRAEVVKVEVTPKDLPKEVADDLVKKCIEEVKKMRFVPPMKNGRPASQHATIEFNFNGEEKADKQK